MIQRRKEEMEDNEKKVADGVTDSEKNLTDFEIEGLNEEDVREIQKIFVRFIKKYKENPERKISEWLAEQLERELPNREPEEIRKIAETITESIEEYERDLEDLNCNCEKGKSKETWFADKIEDSAKGIAINKYGNYLKSIQQNFANANAQMTRTVLTADGSISQNINLDGFIAEQYHVNNFNAKAVLEKSPYRARVCVPESGQYTKNSVDVMIDNIKTGQKGVARYQFKFGKDSKATIDLLKHGNYDNQRIVVPQGQLDEVGRALPGKTVTDYIGGTEKIKVKSDPISKDQLKQLQADIQQNNIIPETDWNNFQTREMALNIGKQAGIAGIQAAFLGIGIHLAEKAFKNEKIEIDEVIRTGLVTGSDAFIKAAVAGALIIANDENKLPFLHKKMQPETITKIVCVAIENLKICWKVAKGELSLSEGAECMGRTSVAMYAGMSAGMAGTTIGAGVFSFIPVVGPILGGIVGGIVGYSAGSKFGETIFDSVKKVAKSGTKAVKKVVEFVSEKAKNIKNRVIEGFALL